ncbi:glycosyltransferase family 4 protein [Denitratimonas sp. CY0512]|uniref:glycosyltransferase family 4 protein n=1 Tax=Denitratimonas sp. CY0512 TaxID=3131940 RepID=UPI0030B5E65A
MKYRLVILVSHPIQYYAPLYRELVARDNIDVHVVYLSDTGANAYHDVNFGRTISWDIPLLDGYPHSILQPGIDLQGLSFIQKSSPGLKETLQNLSPDALLVYGYASRMNWEAVRWAAKNRTRVLYTSDSNANNPRDRLKACAKYFIVRKFFVNVDAFLCTSEANVEYVKRYGAPEKTIFRQPFSVDVSRFSAEAPDPESDREFDFIWAGKFMHRKRPQDFILALDAVAKGSDVKINAVLAGDGPLLDSVKEMAIELPSNVRVQFAGFVNQSAMPQMLQQAHAFAFTSESEPYGLIATEAAAAGLALIVAEGIGCVGDTVLAQPNVNALIYPPGNIDALSRAMLRLLTEKGTLIRMQQASREIAQEHDIPSAAAVIEKAVCDVVTNSHRK